MSYVTDVLDSTRVILREVLLFMPINNSIFRSIFNELFPSIQKAINAVGSCDVNSSGKGSV